MSAILLGPKPGQKRTVKNLGYLFRNWGQIQEFHVIGNDARKSGPEFTLRVLFKDGRAYETEFASWQVALDRFWFRSIFEGIPVYFWDCIVKGSTNRFGSGHLERYTLNETVCTPTQVWRIAYIANQKPETRHSTGADYALTFVGKNDRNQILR